VLLVCFLAFPGMKFDTVLSKAAGPDTNRQATMFEQPLDNTGISSYLPISSTFIFSFTYPP
jgi:hypothetical protein